MGFLAWQVSFDAERETILGASSGRLCVQKVLVRKNGSTGISTGKKVCLHQYSGAECYQENLPPTWVVTLPAAGEKSSLVCPQDTSSRGAAGRCRVKGQGTASSEQTLLEVTWRTCEKTLFPPLFKKKLKFVRGDGACSNEDLDTTTPSKP